MPAEMGKKLFDNCLDFRYEKHIDKKSEIIYIHTHYEYILKCIRTYIINNNKANVTHTAHILNLE